MVWAQLPEIWLHAHNDYEKDVPLFKALKYEFRSLEVDVFLHEGRLVVSHIPFQLDVKPGLEELYIHPMARLQSENFWQNYPAQPLRLMIDMKEATQAGVDSLRALIQRYPRLFTGLQAPVRVFLSGGASRHFFRPSDTLYWGMDDPLPDLWHNRVQPDAFTMQASMSWQAFRRRYLWSQDRNLHDSLARSMTSWFRQRSIPVRLYAAGNRPRQWKRLSDWGFTVINVDRYKRAQRWLRAYRRVAKVR